MLKKHFLSGFSVLFLIAPVAWAGVKQELTSEGLIRPLQKQLIAQKRIEKGEVYNLINGGATRTRQSSTVRASKNPRTDLIPRDILTTDPPAKAEILFDQDTIIRLGEATSFVFPEGLRDYQLNNGTLVSMIRPGRGGGTVKTPTASVVAKGTAIYIQQCSDKTTALVAVLTNNESNVDPTRVTSTRGALVSLRAGQLVRIINGVMQPVQTFSLRGFYQNTQLGAGLGPNQENVITDSPTDVQPTFKEVREETMAAVNAQPEGNFDFAQGVPNVCGNAQQTQPIRGLW